MDKPILAQWLKAGFIHQETFHPTEAGAPQGGICSPVLANLTLDGLEKQLAEHFPKTSKIHLVRFADDFVVTGKDKHLLETEVKPLIEQFLRERGLSLSPKKTTITHIDDGFDFLGQNIRKYEGTLRITPARKSVKAILTKVRQIIKANPQATAGYLIGQLNPVIRGWVNYHRHVVSKKTFSALDHQIFQALWRWAKRRHRNQSNQWIKAKYFPPSGGRKWRFSGPLPDSQGTLQTVHLFLASSVPIKRHIKVRAKANPYDPQWEPYFERRLETKMRDTLQPNRVARHLWLEQAGRCPVCHQFITTETGWEKHHLLWRAYGGLNTLDNLGLLHPNCHKQVHSQRLTVQKPRPSPGV
jgi:RNA-directed DNA polymerase